MVEERLRLDNEVEEILRCINSNHNFLLSGGAGSGKTYSLVEVIRQVIFENPTAKIACMTYTNAAAKEIEERVSHKNLNVSTIHDFLWDNIRHFQKELKQAIIALIKDGTFKGSSVDEDENLLDSYFDNLEEGIQYKEYLRIKEGIISHDEVLDVANHLFKEYPKLCTIVIDKYPFIFIDEYQDTAPQVIEILLKHFKTSSKKSVIGFFGDAMQSIYANGIGNLNKYKEEVQEIQKEQNRRNPQTVIDLANKLRTDGIQQKASSDENAPNMVEGKIKEGKILFVYTSEEDVSKARDYLSEKHQWNFNNSKETKELNLTHNLIADKAGFKDLMDIYDKDPVIKLKNLILSKIKENQRKGEPGILKDYDNDTFDVVADKFELKNRDRILKKDSLLENLADAKLYNQLKDKLFSEVRKIYFNKDALIDDKKQDADDESKKGSKRDNLIKHLFKIQNNIMLYQNGRYNEFLRVTDYRKKIISIKDKTILKNNIGSLVNVGDKSIEEVIRDANEKGICLIDDNLEKFIRKNEYLYNRVKEVGYKTFQKLYNYLEGETPFSTQHKIKGTEFDNVFVILDNGGWPRYSFKYLFADSKNENVLQSTQKIFYVCCTRAKENLAVFYCKPSEGVINQAKEWFGEENVLDLDSE